MKTLKLIALIGLLSFGVQAQQNTMPATTLSAAMTAAATTLTVASATGINAPTAGVPGSMLYIIDIGERVGQLVQVQSLSGTTVKFSPRGSGANGNAHRSGAVVLVGTSPNWFYTSNPTGPCTTATILVTPYVNTNTGEQWLCSTLTTTWVPGWGNRSAPNGVTAAVASAAGAIVPGSPLFHVTGTAAITGFTIGSMIGFTGGSFTVIPDGAFTTTTAGNIGIASTAVAGKALTFTWDSNAVKWYPNY
jgi:hypothetical protein